MQLPHPTNPGLIHRATGQFDNAIEIIKAFKVSYRYTMLMNPSPGPLSSDPTRSTLARRIRNTVRTCSYNGFGSFV